MMMRTWAAEARGRGTGGGGLGAASAGCPSLPSQRRGAGSLRCGEAGTRCNQTNYREIEINWP